jgi:hypothetical protein
VLLGNLQLREKMTPIFLAALKARCEAEWLELKITSR